MKILDRASKGCKSMSRVLLIIVGSIAALLVMIALLGTALRPIFGGPRLQHEGKIKIMIVSQNLLKNEIQTVDASMLDEINGVAASGSEKDGAKGKAAGEKKSSTLRLVGQALQDTLGGAIKEDMIASQRFTPVADTEVVGALDKYDQSRKAPPKSTLNETFGKGAITKSSAAGTVTTQTGSEEVPRGLTEAGKDLGADYVMVVSIGEPKTEASLSISAGDARLILASQPVINCEIYAMRSDGPVYRLTEQLARPVVQEVPLRDNINEMGAVNRFLVRLNKAVSQRVVAWTLQNVARAEIIQTKGSVFINRGSNDGVKAGDIYQVEHESALELREGAGGRSLGRAKTVVGSIRIDKADAVTSSATFTATSDGAKIVVGDIVDMPDGMSASTAEPQTGDSAAVPLGARRLIDEGSKTPLRQASVAIDQIQLTSGGRPLDAAPLARALASALQRDHRIMVLSRADLDKIRHERELDERASGNYAGSSMEGMRTSSYLIVGEFEIDSTRHANRVSVGDVSQVVSSTTSTRSHGALRANSVDGALVESAPVSISGGSTDDLADAAARALLLRLFPMTVVQAGPSGPIVLDRGQDADVTVGDRFRVYSVGSPVIDPNTHVTLSEGARTYEGDVVVTQVQSGVSQARFASAPFAIAPGDAVEQSATQRTAPHSKPRRTVSPRTVPGGVAPSVRW